MRNEQSIAALMAQTRDRMGQVFTSNQVLGRLQTIGCVAVEITQKCNLDCTLCYLSEHSQAVQDIPIEEVYRRLDDVVKHFGKGAHVQITGGDPTLRKHTELIEIVRYARNIGLYPALFTNGIAATAELLKTLAAAGLCDVAFHVDTTQKRQGFADEIGLNAIREEYIQRARGTGLNVIFNTTVHKDNFAEIPALVEFFKSHADVVGLASFQLQAETGRGEWGSRDVIISQKTVQRQLESGLQQELPWDVMQVGHSECHNYLPMMIVNDRAFPLADDKVFFADFIRDFSDINWDRHDHPLKLIGSFLWATLLRPVWWPRLLKRLAKYVRSMGLDFIKARGRAHKLTFFVQNFMDASALNMERVHACSFMVMTAQGPVSMCEHNARRDDFILQPLELHRDGQVINYQPFNERRRQSAPDAAKIIPALLIKD